MIRIGFDAKRLFRNFTGLGNYSRNIVQALANAYPENEWHLYAPRLNEHWEVFPFLKPPFHVHTAPGPFKAYWRSKGVVADLQKHGIELFHGLSHEIPLGLHGIKSVVTIHDVIFRRYPDMFPWFDRQVYDWKWRHACANANKVIAISEQTKRDLMAIYQVPAEKISVVYQPCARNFTYEIPAHILNEVQSQYGLPKQYLLYVGSLVARKNVGVLLEALALLPMADRQPLVVVGNGPEQAALERKALQLGVADWVLWRGNVSNQHLPSVYAMASVFLYPSVYEGFGIPLLEALQCGTPVLAANTSSLPEAGGPNSLYHSPENANEVADMLRRILSDSQLRRLMVESGFAYAKRFTHERIASDMMDVYLEVLGRR